MHAVTFTRLRAKAITRLDDSQPNICFVKIAVATAWARVVAFSFISAFCTYSCAVCSEIARICEISQSVLPAATQERHSRSRGVSLC